MRVDSTTGAADDLYRSYRPRLEDFSSAFRAGPADRGAIFAVDGRIAGVEVFDSPSTFGRYLPRLVRSYALDAIESRPPVSAAPTEHAVERFRRTLVEAWMSEHGAVGLGTHVRIESAQVAGGALVADDAVIHLCAFAVATAPQSGPTRRRRRSWSVLH